MNPPPPSRASPQGAKMAHASVAAMLRTHVCPYTLKFLCFLRLALHPFYLPCELPLCFSYNGRFYS